jgi:hypothetical protein
MQLDCSRRNLLNHIQGEQLPRIGGVARIDRQSSAPMAPGFAASFLNAQGEGLVPVSGRCLRPWTARPSRATIRGLPIYDRQKVVYAAAAIPKSVNKACMPIRSFS